MRAEEVIFLFLMLPGFRDVYREPAALLRVKLSPAVIAGNLRRIFTFRQRETDLESGRNVLRVGHGDQDRMKIGAIAALRITGPQGIALAPAGSALVVAHGGERVIVERARRL